MKKHKRNFF